MYTDATGTATKPSKQQIADHLYRRWQSAQTERMPWLAVWQETAQYVRPSRQQVAYRTDIPPVSGFEDLFDGTAIQANMVHASGCMSRLTPAMSPWFAFEPPRDRAHIDEVKRWYAQCTEIAIEALATSNFYTEIHECYLDRGAFGSACMHIEGTMKHPLNFRTHEIGTFAFALGADGRVDTVFRELDFNAREASQVFRPEELPECIRKELEANVETTAKHKFLHALYPRSDSERDGFKLDGPNKAIASVYLYVKDKTIVRIGGYEEMPCLGSRYLCWGNHAYGFSPAWQALPECRQLNELQQNLDVLAEIAANPRILLPSDHEGEVDMRSLGVTYFKEADKVPREWATGGRYDIGLERVKQKQDAIKQAYHVELFQMWSAMTKQMTALEASAREQEKMDLFSPTFTLLTTELLGPALRRVFALLLRQNVFPMPPEQAVQINYRGAWEVPDPQIRYISRLALALKAHAKGGFSRLMSMMGPLLEVDPSLMDLLDLDAAIREMSYDENIPTRWLRSAANVEQLRQARAAAQAQQMQAQQAAVGAETLAKLKGAGIEVA
jgi:hypothetical protein